MGNPVCVAAAGELGPHQDEPIGQSARIAVEDFVDLVPRETLETAPIRGEVDDEGALDGFAPLSLGDQASGERRSRPASDVDESRLGSADGAVRIRADVDEGEEL